MNLLRWCGFLCVVIGVVDSVINILEWIARMPEGQKHNEGLLYLTLGLIALHLTKQDKS